MLRSSLRRQRHIHPSTPLQTARPLLGLRWYLSLSFALHLLAVGVAVFYFAFLSAPTPKTLSVPLHVLLMPPEVPPQEALSPLAIEEIAPSLVKTTVVKPTVETQSERRSKKAARIKPQSLPKPKNLPPVPVQKTVPDKLPEESLASFYPDAYVPKRLNGEVMLRLFIDVGTGKILAVRVEVPSPYPLFNEAAKEAVAVLLPKVTGVGQAEVLLPVRFRYNG